MPGKHRILRMVINSDVEIREESLFGSTYTVVPVVAMVEGVRFGANQKSAELGLADDFGENVSLWNNRPLVLNHPQNSEGNYVSANSPSVLESYAFGITMNAFVEDKKLKLEAWIDKARISALGGDFQETYDRIIAQNAEDIVEVSVGFFCDVIEKKGKFKGQAYTGIWKNIKPDHLAILPNAIGACSVADGCGIPRINKENEMPPELVADTTHTCTCEDPNACTCTEETPEVQTKKRGSGVPKIKANKEDRTQEREQIQTLVSQTISSNVYSRDALQLLNAAAKQKFGASADPYVYGFTQDYMIFDMWESGSGYKVYKQGINVSESTVEFVGEKSEVILLTRLVDLETKEDLKPNVVNTEDDMPNDNEQTTTTEKPEVQTQEQPKALTTQEYIEQAPVEVREVLQRNMKVYEDQKSSLIKTLMEQKGNKFTEEELKTHTIETLEKFVSLAQVSFVGQATATSINIRDNVSDNVIAPKVFEKKTSEQAA